MNEYSRTYETRWSDLDANGHVNYSAYIDAAGDLRGHWHPGLTTWFHSSWSIHTYASLQN